MEIKRVKVITNCPHCAFKATTEGCTYCGSTREVESEMAFTSFAFLVEKEIKISKELEI